MPDDSSDLEADLAELAAAGGEVPPDGPPPPRLTDEERAERDQQIFALFIAGNTQGSIARQFGISRQRVSAILSEGMKDTAEHRDLLKSQALGVYVERLENLIQATWVKVEEGDLKAIEVARRLLEQQARLYGLNSPAGRGSLGAIPPLSDPGVDGEIDEPANELEAWRARRKSAAPEKAEDVG